MTNPNNVQPNATNNKGRRSGYLPTTQNLQPTTYSKPKINFVEGKDRIVEMDRMRKMIADHMVYSKQTSPHVTSYIEVDVTNLVNWRNENKDKFQEKHNEKLTFTTAACFPAGQRYQPV